MWKIIQKYVGVISDGIPGPKTGAAIAEKLGLPSGDWKSIQRFVGVSPDGIPGNVTAQAIANRFGLKITLWPTQAEVRSNKSIFGKSGDESNLVTLSFPYQMYFEGNPIKSNSTRVHRLIAEPLKRIFDKTLAYYGKEKIHKLGLDRFDGCFNNRTTVGGSVKSMHAWGIALDMDANRNDYYTKKPIATLSHPECEKFWEFVEAEGAVSLGRERNLDWMHFQFARLS